MGRREEKKRQIRLSLLRAGVSLIGEEGLDAVTIAAITRRAGVAKGTFYNYFESKEDLVAAAVSVGQRDWQERLAALKEEHPTLEERLEELFRRTCDWVQENPEITWIWLTRRLAEGAGRVDDGNRGIFHRILQHLFADARERGQLNTPRPASHLADDLEGIFLLQMARWYHGRQDYPLYAAVHDGIRNYLHGVLLPQDRLDGGVELP